MKTTFKFEQKSEEIKHEYPTTTIKKPIYDDALMFILDIPKNTISVQLILMLYRTEIFEHGKEIDAIHYSTSNTSFIPLRQLSDKELMSMLTDATNLCVKKCNDILKNKYPKAKILADYSQQSIRGTMGAMIQRSKKENPIFLEGTQWGIA